MQLQVCLTGGVTSSRLTAPHDYSTYRFQVFFEQGPRFNHAHHLAEGTFLIGVPDQWHYFAISTVRRVKVISTLVHATDLEGQSTAQIKKQAPQPCNSKNPGGLGGRAGLDAAEGRPANNVSGWQLSFFIPILSHVLRNVIKTYFVDCQVPS